MFNAQQSILKMEAGMDTHKTIAIQDRTFKFGVSIIENCSLKIAQSLWTS